MKTPHLDELSATGLHFDFAYTNFAYCAPSRNSCAPRRSHQPPAPSPLLQTPENKIVIPISLPPALPPAVHVSRAPAPRDPLPPKAPLAPQQHNRALQS